MQKHVGQMLKAISLLAIGPILLFTMKVFGSELCKLDEVQKRHAVAIATLNQQIAQVKDVLKDGPRSNVVVENIFGHQYSIEKTDKYIQDVNKSIGLNQGVAAEYTSLGQCLEYLKLKDKLSEIQKKSILLSNLKIKIFEENKRQNDGLRRKLSSEGSLPSLKNEIDIQRKKSEAEKKALEKDLIKAESENSKEKSQLQREISFYRSTLTKIKIDLLDQKIEESKALEKKLNDFEDKSKRLSKLVSFTPTSQSAIEKNFEEIEAIWLEITNENLFQLFKTRFNFKLSSIPQPPALVLKEGKETVLPLAALRLEVEDLKLITIRELSLKKEQEIKLLNDLILQVNNVRTVYYKKISRSYVFQKVFSSDGLALVKNEILASPYRLISYFYSKYLYLDEQISSGRKGIIALSVDFFRFLFIIAALFFIKALFQKAYSSVDSGINKLAWKFNTSSALKGFSSLWSKFKDNAVNVFWLIFLETLKFQGFAENYLLIIEIFEIIIAAKILRSLVVLFLGSVSKVDFRSFENFKVKAGHTSSKFSNIFLFYFLTMLIVEAAIGHVYIYSFIRVLVLSYSVLQIINTSSVWEEEFRRFIERRFSGIIIEKINKALSILPRKLRATVVFFSIIILSTSDFLIRITENFEVSKKISANLFKKQIEQIEAEEGSDDKIPTEYKEEFSLSSLADESEYVVPDEKIEESLKLEISDWFSDKSEEHCLVVFGDKGVGKTTLLKHISLSIEQEQGDSVSTIYTKMPPKTIKKRKLQDFIVETFDYEPSDENFDLYAIDRKLEKKTVVVIDEAQNVFLSYSGGFEAYYSLINMINLDTENIFWVILFNKYSWLYLDRAFGRTQFFRNVFELRGWNDLKIKELILKRHEKSHFQLSYDLLINATRSQDEMDRYSSIESKFFKLLWELSKGNPRAALNLWLTALSRKSKKAFNVNIPKELELLELGKLSDDLMFIIAHILKHENLTSSEVESTTNLPKGIVRNAIKVGQEKRFFYKDGRGRYMVDIASQYGLIKYLRLKNFLYGN
jgi:energy-coupling factor transporter ATP-binding protein EcfA2